MLETATYGIMCMQSVDTRGNVFVYIALFLHSRITALWTYINKLQIQNIAQARWQKKLRSGRVGICVQTGAKPNTEALGRTRAFRVFSPVTRMRISNKKTTLPAPSVAISSSLLQQTTSVSDVV